MLPHERGLQDYLKSPARKQHLFDSLNAARAALKNPKATPYDLWQAKLSLKHFERLLDEASDTRNTA